LKKEFGCSTIKEAKELLEKTSAKEVKLSKEYQSLKSKFEEEFKDILEAV
jgi:hypothetical protein